MSFFRIVRGIIGLIVGGMIVGMSGVITLLLGLIETALIRPFVRRPSMLRHAPTIVGRIVTSIVYRGIMGINVQRSGSLPPFDVDDRVVVMGNHPTNLALFLFLGTLGTTIDKPVVWIGKQELLLNPIIGLAAFLAQCFEFIDREDRAGALKRIRQRIGHTFATNAALGIFPDGRRPDPKRIAESRKKFAKEMDVSDFTHTLIPREGGIGAIIDHAGGPVVVVNITSGFDRPEMSIFDALNLVDATYRFHFEIVAIPGDRQSRIVTLNRIWREKNRCITRWKTHAKPPSAF